MRRAKRFGGPTGIYDDIINAIHKHLEKVETDLNPGPVTDTASFRYQAKPEALVPIRINLNEFCADAG